MPGLIRPNRYSMNRRFVAGALGAVALGLGLTAPSLSPTDRITERAVSAPSDPDDGTGILAGSSAPEILAYAEPATGDEIADEGSASDAQPGDSSDATADPGILASGTGTPNADTTTLTPSTVTADEITRQVGAIRDELVQMGEELLDTPVGVRGRVVGPDGPVQQAVVRIGEKLATTDEQGLFWVDGAARNNEIIGIDAPGYYSRAAAAALTVGLSNGLVDLGTIRLQERTDNSVFVLAGGDVSFGRRYLDPDSTQRNDRVPDDNPNALIRPRNARNDTTALLGELAETFNPYDLVTVSLESVVTDAPPAPNPDRSSHLFSLPRSLDALANAGVDHVALATDRITDFGDAGIELTRSELDEDGTGYSGAGQTVSEAVVPWAADVGGATVAISSFAAVEGAAQNNPIAASFAGGGAADLNDDALAQLALREADAFGVSIAHAHTGYEFTETPGAHARDRLEFLARNGADLVVGHHPNVAQGFDFVGDSLVAHSLGNLAFDQYRVDGAIGALVEARWDGGELGSAAVIPVLLDDFVPTRLVGEPADLTLRRIGHASGDDVVLVPDMDRASIVRRSEAKARTRTVTLTAEPDAFGTAVLDLRAHREPFESVSAVVTGDETNERVEAALGRDVLLFGSMEDVDTDNDRLEVPYWSLTGNASFGCVDHAARGTMALCSVRSSTNRTASVIAFETPVRVLGDRLNEPNKDLTLVVQSAGNNRGDVYVDAIWRASVGSREFGTEQVLALPAGSHSFAQSWVDLEMPSDDPAIVPTPELPFGTKLRRENARAVELRIRHLPPPSGTGVALLDDVAIVSWADPTVEPIATVSTPNPYDFVRLTGVAPGTRVEITFTSWSVDDAAVSTAEAP